MLPDISTASVISASVAMSPAATTATLVTSDEESVKTADHLPSASTVAAQLRSMLQRAETTGEEVASESARLFDCLASDTFMNGPEDDAAVDGCSHPHSVWKELDGSSPDPASQSIARIHTFWLSLTGSLSLTYSLSHSLMRTDDLLRCHDRQL